MKILIKILSLLILMGSLSSAQVYKRIVISTNIPGTMIFIDDSLSSRGSLNALIETGMHFIIIKENGRGWNKKVIEDTIFVKSSDEEINLNYNFEENLYLETAPEDVYVFENDSLIGHTPLYLSSRIKNISLSKPKYTPKQINLNKLDISKPISLEFIGKENNRSFVKSTLFKLLIGSAVALGTTAAYFKIKADNKHDKYLETRNKKYLDETDKLDLYSGIAFGMLQINFGVLIYYFLTQ
jgi:opacity protein-like surface antigen